MPIVWYFYNAELSLKVNIHQELLNKSFHQRIATVSWLISERILGCHMLCQNLAFLKQVDLYTIFICRIYVWYIYVFVYIYVYICICLHLTAYYIPMYVYTYRVWLVFHVFQSELRHTTNHLNVYFASDFSLGAFITFQFVKNSTATFPKRLIYLSFLVIAL